MGSKKRLQTVVIEGGGRFWLKCLICKRRSARLSAASFERSPVSFDGFDEAKLYGDHHRKSAFHHKQVRLASNTRPRKEERMLDRIFDLKPRTPCKECNLWHAKHLSCDIADQIQEEEDTA